MRERTHMKVVNHVYRTTCSTVRQPPGFGDYLRGTISLAILSLENGFDLRLDFSQHPIGKFLRNKPTSLGSPESVVEFFNERTSFLLEFIENLKDDQTVSITTNLEPDEGKINNDVRKLIREQLAFNTLIEESASRLSKEISDENFAILHVRVEDQHSRTDNVEIKQLYKYTEINLIPSWGNRLAVLSNNKGVKWALSAKFGLPFIDTGTVHLGECNSADSDIRDTLIDFVLMSRASAIFSYSAYIWKSGFSKWCASLNNVPFVEIRFDPDDFQLASLVRFFSMKLKNLLS